MRLGTALTIGFTLVALTAVGACGSSEDGGDSATSSTAATGTTPADASGQPDASGPAGDDGGLPKASDTAAIADYLSRYTQCQSPATGDEYDNGHDGDAWGTDESDDPAWAIQERAVCTDGSERPIALLSVSDMRKFQAAAKASGDRFLVGEDFAVVPVGDETIRSLQRSGLRFLACDPDLAVPSGFEKTPALVDGCALTDYVPE
ncbi:hypothetical protein [Streptomyces hilarionis]|uniref:hypothetical protein n=1 Tax=Streptomyces hilarionis TaxID=2839954 RepID=UPI00211A1886|nr:hypothetical protein [Streptomyces hilarionis]